MHCRQKTWWHADTTLSSEMSSHCAQMLGCCSRVCSSCSTRGPASCMPPARHTWQRCLAPARGGCMPAVTAGAATACSRSCYQTLPPPVPVQSGQLSIACLGSTTSQTRCALRPAKDGCWPANVAAAATALSHSGSQIPLPPVPIELRKKNHSLP